MAEPLQYLLITVKVAALEKVSFGDIKNHRLFVNTLTVNGKHYLLNRENLRQQIQMQLSEKQKTFSEFFFAVSKFFQKKRILAADVSLEIPAPKNMFR